MGLSHLLAAMGILTILFGEVLPMIVTLMEKSLLLLPMIVTLLLHFIYASIEIGSPLMSLFKVLDLLGWVMILHILLLVLDPFKLRCLMALLEP